jgi:hypothetical protein
MAKTTLVDRHQDLPATDYADKYAGEGTHVAAEHSVTPRISILQGATPQVKKNNVAYVEGAQPGMIFLSSYHAPLIDGEEGIIFQPCLLQTPWEVRTPRESGAANFVGMFATPQPDWTERHDPKGFTYYTTRDGNIAHQVHIQIGLLHIDGNVLPYAIKFAGTGIFISKQWNSVISTRRNRGSPLPTACGSRARPMPQGSGASGRSPPTADPARQRWMLATISARPSSRARLGSRTSSPGRRPRVER